ncbi:MAG TPA: hypothetical protein VFA77_15205 [Candidatus Eisenbacteria bacterium]|nr:hypothetical protein [Candidatus Eisenbacteria bacterium]
MPTEPPNTAKPISLPKFPTGAVPFGANEVRLSFWQWLAVSLLVVLVALSVPLLWEKLERFDTGPDYRIPYQLSKDYWLYGRRLRQATDPNRIVVLGDSVTWGEYVLPDGTLSHFLNQESGEKTQFVNGGVNGLFPLALEGLIDHYGKSLRHRKVIVHCNVLWMTSPKADLSTDKEERFNHADLVPQFSPRIPCYKADANARLSAVVERNVRFLEWINHLQNAYFDQKSILNWTLADDGSDPPRYPNAWKNPFAQITFTVPPEPAVDPERGPKSPRHKPWSTTGEGSTRFEWVPLDRSLQWAAFQRLVKLLQSRGNDVLVVVGPFNEHIMAEENRPAFRSIRDGIADWLATNHVTYVKPETLPSSLYADASHPLTEGYQLLAKRLYSDAAFQKWMQGR